MAFRSSGCQTIRDDQHEVWLTWLEFFPGRLIKTSTEIGTQEVGGAIRHGGGEKLGLDLRSVELSRQRCGIERGMHRIPSSCMRESEVQHRRRRLAASRAPDGNARVMLSSTGTPLTAVPSMVRLMLIHPTRAGADRRVDMQRGPDGIYRGQAGILPPGRWRVGVETDEWRLPTVEVEGAIRAQRIGAAARQ